MNDIIINLFKLEINYFKKETFKIEIYFNNQKKSKYINIDKELNYYFKNDHFHFTFTQFNKLCIYLLSKEDNIIGEIIFNKVSLKNLKNKKAKNYRKYIENEYHMSIILDFNIKCIYNNTNKIIKSKITCEKDENKYTKMRNKFVLNNLNKGLAEKRLKKTENELNLIKSEFNNFNNKRKIIDISDIFINQFTLVTVFEYFQYNCNNQKSSEFVIPIHSDCDDIKSKIIVNTGNKTLNIKYNNNIYNHKNLLNKKQIKNFKNLNIKFNNHIYSQNITIIKHLEIKNWFNININKLNNNKIDNPNILIKQKYSSEINLFNSDINSRLKKILKENILLKKQFISLKKAKSNKLIQTSSQKIKQKLTEKKIENKTKISEINYNKPTLINKMTQKKLFIEKINKKTAQTQTNFNSQNQPHNNTKFEILQKNYNKMNKILKNNITKHHDSIKSKNKLKNELKLIINKNKVLIEDKDKIKRLYEKEIEDYKNKLNLKNKLIDNWQLRLKKINN